MTKNWVGLIIGMALIAGPTLAKPKGPVDPTDRKLKGKIDHIAARTLEKGGPGFSVAVVRNQRVVLCEAYGLANVELGVPLTTESALNIGSVSKHFTAWAVLLLEQRGLLSTDDDVHKYLPELPDYGAPLILSHLLYQTSGLPEYLKLLGYAGLFPNDYRRFADVYELLEGGGRLDSPPGTAWSYSNTNYALLAEIVQRRTGQSFGAWLRENLFAPLGMDHTVVPASNFTIVKNRADSYWAVNGPLERYHTTAYIPGPTLVYTSASDMARWMINLRSGKVGGAGLFERLCAKGKLEDGKETWYSMGIARSTYRGTETVGHSGQDGGFVADMTYCPELDLGVAVLSNSLTIDPKRVRDAVLDFVTSGEAAPEVATDPAPPAGPGSPGKTGFPLDQVLGNYGVDGSGDIVSLFVDGGELWANYLGLGNVGLIPRDERSASNSEGDIVIRTLERRPGGGERIELNLKGTILEASRLSQDAKELEGLTGIVGAYYSPLLGTVYSVVEEGGRLELRQRRSVGTHDLAYAGRNTLVCSLGELKLTFDASGKVDGFTLWHETVSSIRFVRIPADGFGEGRRAGGRKTVGTYESFEQAVVVLERSAPPGVAVSFPPEQAFQR